MGCRAMDGDHRACHPVFMSVDLESRGGQSGPPQLSLLSYLQITEDSYEDMRRKRLPLGTTARRYNYFRSSLADALTKSGITLTKCDVRLQGSAATFYSVLKKIPYSRTEIRDLYVSLQSREPRPFEIDEVCEQLEKLWPDKSKREQRRMFDLLYRLKIDLQRSDIDVQISSGELAAAAVQRVSSNVGSVEARSRTISPQYGFFPRHIISDIAPLLDIWAVTQTAILGRTVTLAVFDESGPTSEISRHRPTDWIVSLGSD
jgi:hypothetical protein